MLVYLNAAKIQAVKRKEQRKAVPTVVSWNFPQRSLGFDP